MCNTVLVICMHTRRHLPRRSLNNELTPIMGSGRSGFARLLEPAMVQHARNLSTIYRSGGFQFMTPTCFRTKLRSILRWLSNTLWDRLDFYFGLQITLFDKSLGY